MTIDRILSLIAIIVSFIAVPASGYLSYRYAIKGERRKEFNAVADNIRQRLREHLNHLEQDIYPSGSYIEVSQEDFDLLVDVSYPANRKAIKELCNAYIETLHQSVRLKENGDYEIIGFDEAKKVLINIMKHIERK